MRVRLNENMKVFHGHVPVELVAGQVVNGDLAEMLLAGARKKVTQLDDEPPAEEPVEDEPSAEVPGTDENTVDAQADVTGTIENVLEWVGGSKDRAREAHAAESAKDKPRPRLLARLDEILA